MTAHSRLQASTPEEHKLVVRDLRFSRDRKAKRGADPVGSAWHAALSASFPRGEAMFIDAVKAHREGLPPRLAAQVRDFIRQEVNHSREHLAFNRAVADAGYDMAGIDERIKGLIEQTQKAPPIVQLAITCALEHFTAIFAHEFLKNPRDFASAGVGDQSLWLWHSVEEIEHKAVAFDVWNQATRDWTARKRYLVRCLVMLRTSTRFMRNRLRDTRELLRQDGITGWRAWRGIVGYLIGKPGMLRRIFPMWLAYFRPGFHPWDHDDRHLIAEWEARQ